MLRIQLLNEEAKEKRDLKRKEKKDGKLGKIHIKLWKYNYMVQKDTPKLKEELGLTPECTYEELFNAIEVDVDGDECDLEGYDQLKMADEWIEQGKNKT